MMHRGMVVFLAVVGLAISGCRASSQQGVTDEAAVDEVLTTQSPVEVMSPPAIPQEPRPGFTQEPKQTP